MNSLEDIIKDRQISISSIPIGGDLSDNGTLTFLCSLRADRWSIECRYSCGSAFPIQAYRRGEFSVRNPQHVGRKAYLDAAENLHDRCIDYTAARAEIRLSYLPSAGDVLACLLVDDASVEGLRDGLAWAEDFGMLDGTAESARKAIRSWDEIKARAHPLRCMLGPRFEDAMRLAQER